MAPSVFDPKLICYQIVALQCFHYLMQAAVLEGFQLIFGTDVSLRQIFTPDEMEVESAEGLLNIIAVFLTFMFGSILLAIIVQKSKKCMDFTVTLFILHLVFCAFYKSFPLVWLWWIVNTCGIGIMVFLGEYLCARSELREIPLFMGNALDT